MPGTTSAYPGLTTTSCMEARHWRNGRAVNLRLHTLD
jgi:hypothetical protein